MAANSHPLTQPPVVSALALLGLCTAGWSLITAQFLLLGLLLSIIGSVANIWLFWSSLRTALKAISRPSEMLNWPPELWIGIGISGMGVAVPFWLSSVQQHFPFSEGKSRWLIPSLLMLAAILGFLFGIRERLRVSPKRFSEGLYVGQIHASFSRFTKDHCVELAIRGFNGTGKTIAVGQLRGAIGFRESIDGRETEVDALPIPAILADRTNISNIVPFSEIFIVLEQRVPRTNAERMSELFESGHSVTFDLRSLQIPIHAVDRPEEFATLPTHSLSLKRNEGIIVNRIAYASMSITLGTTATVG